MTKLIVSIETKRSCIALRSALFNTVAGMALFGLSTPAFAQAADGAEDSGSIIVTARLQSETLQEVPVNITSIGMDTLETYQVNEIADAVGRIPGLNVQIGGSGAGAQISLRGIGSTNISSAFDSAVGIDIDGVQVSTQRLLQTAFFDVEQIDVLKGPQSLFFGKSASAGVFSLRSANPTKTWEIGGKASYEFEEQGYTVGGYISGPLSDTLGIRVAGQYQDLEKYVELEAGTPARDKNKGITNFIVRGTLQWDPSDSFSANLKLNYNNQNSETLVGHSDMECGANGVADPVVLGLANTRNFILSGFTAPLSIQIAPSHSCNINDGLYPASDGHPLIDTVPTGTTGSGRDISQAYNETEIFFARLRWDLDLSETLKLSSVSGYLNLDNEYNDNFAYTGKLADGRPAGLMAPFRNGLSQYTQELRITSDYSGAFNFMLGAFWEKRDIPYSTSQNGFNVSLARPDPITGYTFDWFAERNSKADALSFFGSTTIDVTDKLELSGGLRWTNEHKSTTIGFPYVHLDNTIFVGALLGGFLGSGFFAGPIKFSDSNLSPEITVKYQASDDVNIYASYKTGFKSGGIDNNALPAIGLADLNSADPATRTAAEASLRFGSETSKGGEIGVKTQFADRTFTLNTALFYYQFTGLQVQIFDPAIFNFVTFNASQLTTQGVDIDWSWRTPAAGLRLSGALSYTDTRYTKEFITQTEDLNGRVAPRAPKLSGNIAVDYKQPLGDSMELGLSGNASYTSSYLASSISFYDDYRQKSYLTLDGAVSIGAPDGNWKLSLIGSNLTNEIWVNTAGAAPFSGAAPGDDRIVTQNRGRQVFVEAAFKF